MPSIPAVPMSSGMVFPMLAAVCLVHLLNDLVQAALPAIYPLLKDELNLSFSQIGLLTLVFQCTASLLQPWVGFHTDKHPKPYLLPIGMGFTLVGLLGLAFAQGFSQLLLAAGLVGIGSSTFHPEASRVARLASGGRYGFAQSFFQVGGNAGTAIGPLLVALIVIPRGQWALAWFGLFACLAIAVLLSVSRWYSHHLRTTGKAGGRAVTGLDLPRGRVAWSLGILALLLFSKYLYMASLTSYYTFYLIGKFDLSVAQAQVYLFLFLGAVAAGTLIGGPVGDRIGRKQVIWVSILGAAPFTLALPYANLFWTGVLSVIIGLILASAFSAIVVFAQELIPGRVGTVSGVCFGLMFGIGGLGAAALGWLADGIGIASVYHLVSFLPLLGICTAFLPDLGRRA